MAMKRYYDVKHKLMHFNVGDFVYLRLDHGYDIPYNKLLPAKLAQRYAGRFKLNGVSVASGVLSLAEALVVLFCRTDKSLLSPTMRLEGLDYNAEGLGNVRR